MKRFVLLGAVVLGLGMFSPAWSGEEHGHGGHEEHEEEEVSSARIHPESAQRMGVVVEEAGGRVLHSTVPLTGRITLNRNTQANVRARFPGIVRAVKVEMGEAVEKGQVLAVVEANESLREYAVVSPLKGVVLERNTNTGDVVGEAPLFVVADLSNVWAKFHVFPRDAAVVRAGQPVEVLAIDRSINTRGTVDLLLPMADEISQTQVAIVIVPNPQQAWKPGMTVEGRVTVGEEEAAVAVKETALQKMEEQGEVVFVLEGDTYKPQAVVTGRRGDGYVEIVEGLAEGTPYVAEGSFIVKSDLLKSTATHAH